ncbi:MAG: hypothetical protein HY047_01365 [Acidobacteria bacterium]|nr:hypothetical protein [Acidobacteriota bacterium]
MRHAAGFLVFDSARGFHQVDDDLVRHPHDHVAIEVAVGHLLHRTVRQRTQRLTQTGDVRSGRLHQEIDIFRRANESSLDDRHAADHDIASPRLVEVTAQRDEIGQARWSGFERAIIWRDHAALSSKVRNR